MPFNEFISLRGQVGGIMGDLCLGLMSSECYLNYTVKASSVATDGSAVVHESRMLAPLVCRAGQGCELSDLFVWGGPLKQQASEASRWGAASCLLGLLFATGWVRQLGWLSH